MDSWSSEELCIRWMPRAAETAYLLTGDRALARRVARRALLRCSAHWQDRRSPYWLEEWFDRTVVAVAARAFWIRAFRFGGRRSRVAGAPPSLDAPERRLWIALQSLPYRQRAALVLRYYSGLTDREVADAIGGSVACARSRLARGTESLAERAGGGFDVVAQLGELLPRLAEATETPSLDDRALFRRVESARWVGILEAVCIAAAIAVLVYVAGGAIASRQSDEGAPPAIAEMEELDDDGGGRVQVGGPDWCPGIRGAQPLSSAGSEGPIRVAEPFAVAQAKGRTDVAAGLADPQAYGPSLRSWPKLAYANDLELVYSFSGGVDQGLTNACGELVAERTWIVVFRGSEGNKTDELALYLLRRGGDWKVWATDKPAVKL